MSRSSGPYRGPERADALLVTALRQRHLLDQLSSARALALWPEAVGAEIAAESQAESCEHGVLTVLTADSIRSHQLQSRSKDIVAKINRLAGQEIVRRLRFHVAPVESLSHKTNKLEESSVRVTDEELEAHALTDEEMREIEQLVTLIRGAEVREQVRHSLEVHYRADKALRARGWLPCPMCGALVAPQSGAVRCTTCERSARVGSCGAASPPGSPGAAE